MASALCYDGEYWEWQYTMLVYTFVHNLGYEDWVGKPKAHFLEGFLPMVVRGEGDLRVCCALGDEAPEGRRRAEVVDPGH